MMTFVICLFIVLMQFLWRYVEDFVGKGLDVLVLAELFFYAALNLIPMALPLSILLASLMSFGNLGERLELLAIKASGVSLLRAMRPLIILVSCISIGAFFFQNEAMPRINVKFRSLMISVKQKSPELDIPEGSFYSGINNYSLYVKKKDPETKMLHGVMIYDTSEGFDNMSVFVCDSGRMRVSANKKFLVLNLFDGQRFANFRQSGMSYKDSKFVRYSRENFKQKEIVIPFNSDFNRLEESSLEGTQISKNIAQLSRSIDSMKLRLDTLNQRDRKMMSSQIYFASQASNQNIDSTDNKSQLAVSTEKVDFDSLLQSLELDKQIMYLNTAANDVENIKSTYMFQSVDKMDTQKRLRQHEIEWHQKFTLSFACLVFFFIGAPLGAIIRKGGLGMPVVISVIFFIIYYIVNNIGYKMARDGVWDVWQGIWLSSFVLFPIGTFLTYKAMNDSALFNVEAYAKYLRNILRIEKRTLNEDTQIKKDFIPRLSDLNASSEAIINLKALSNERLRNIASNHSEYGYDYQTLIIVLSILKDRGDDLEGVKLDIRDYKQANEILVTFKKNSLFAFTSYFLTLALYILDLIVKSDLLWWVMILLLVLYTVFYIRETIYYSDFNKSIRVDGSKGKQKLYLFLGYFAYPAIHYYLLRKVNKEMKKNI